MWIKVTIIILIDINNQSIALEHSNQFKDLGVLVDEKLSFKDHIQDKINKAFSMLGIIKRNFKYLDMYSFILLYKSMVRSQLDYCSSVWSPYKKGDIDAIEKVQKRATKVLPELKNKSYIEWLKISDILVP